MLWALRKPIISRGDEAHMAGSRTEGNGTISTKKHEYKMRGFKGKLIRE